MCTDMKQSPRYIFSENSKMRNSKFEYHLWFKKMLKDIYANIHTYAFIYIDNFLEDIQ